ncbi:protein of unknown function [Streptantibioticus cattleyicolor NRRL 8057 = DSM 46488]|nr:protein of unknown function [Streptantibioticus cattleyicolor NRRL 8057 = DSM 46488]
MIARINAPSPAGVVVRTVWGSSLSRRWVVSGVEEATSRQFVAPASLKLDFCHTSCDMGTFLEQRVQEPLHQPE